MIKDKKHLIAIYMDGFEARDKGTISISCPYGTIQMLYKSFWLAGWHDSDIAHGVKLLN